MFRKCSENVRKILSGEKYKYSKRVTQLFITLLERSSGQNFPEYFFRSPWPGAGPGHCPAAPFGRRTPDTPGGTGKSPWAGGW